MRHVAQPPAHYGAELRQALEHERARADRLEAALAEARRGG